MVSATSSCFFVCVLLCFASFLFLARSRGDFPREPNERVALFVFGDSIYDPGNNDYLNVSVGFKANYPPYGETFFKYPTGRFCDGRVLPDFIAMDAKLPIWKPYLEPGPHQFTNGANFASGGAGVFVDTSPGTLNLRKQLSCFKKVANLLGQELGDTEAKKVLMNAVYMTSIGGVDYFTLDFDDYTEIELEEYVTMVIGNITDVVKEIYEIGGRKFAFQYVGPLGCTPEAKQTYNLSANDCLEELLVLARLHNSMLSNIVQELESQLSGFKYSVFDYYNSLGDRINNPLKYGFKVADVACCGTGTYRGSDCGIEEPYYLCSNPSEYVFFDGGHPSEAANSQIAELWWNGSSNTTWPINMKQLYELEPVTEILSENGGPLEDE